MQGEAEQELLLPPPFLDDSRTVFEVDDADVEEMVENEKVPDTTEGRQVLATSPPTAEVKSPPLPSSWLSTSKSKREIPRAVKIGGAGVACLLISVFALPHACGTSGETKMSTMIVDSDVEDQAKLKKRRHLTEHDFRGSERSFAQTRSSAPTGGISVRERQLLRQENPEDLRQRKRGRKVESRKQTRRGKSVEKMGGTDSMIVFFDETNSDAEVVSKRRGKERVLLPAASTVRISLTQDVVIRGGSATVIALVDKSEVLPAGTKLIGKASAGREGLVSIRFRTVVLPDGQGLNARAEALDSTGSQLIAAEVTGGRREEQESIAKSIGTGAFERAATTVLGGGFLADTARQAITETGRSRRSRSSSSPVIVRLSRDTSLTALFLRELRSKRGNDPR